jgi:hypothetical protein
MKIAPIAQRRIVLIMGVILAIMLFTTAASADRFNEWLSTQGTYSTFIPPDPDFLGWADHAPTLFASIDYAGLATAAYSLSGKIPEISGSVIEKPLSVNRTEVTVFLQTKNANAWAMAYPGDFATSPTLFGHRPTDVAAGAAQALANCSMTLNFINNAGVGGPLPDLVALAGNYAPYVPQTDYLNILFSAQAWGPLTAAFGVPENTPGMLTVLQWGIWDNGQWTYPSEILKVTAPLPASLLLFGSGLLGLLGIRRCRRQ